MFVLYRKYVADLSICHRVVSKAQPPQHTRWGVGRAPGACCCLLRREYLFDHIKGMHRKILVGPISVVSTPIFQPDILTSAFVQDLQKILQPFVSLQMRDFSGFFQSFVLRCFYLALADCCIALFAFVSVHRKNKKSYCMPAACAQ